MVRDVLWVRFSLGGNYGSITAAGRHGEGEERVQDLGGLAFPTLTKADCCFHSFQKDLDIDTYI